MRGRPTPTQEEADLIRTGQQPPLAPAGPTEPPWPPVTNKPMSAETGGGYSTRQATSKP